MFGLMGMVSLESEGQFGLRAGNCADSED